jgi:cyclophilin family peptidyl-prolyl cis-trans isomerase
MAPKLLAAAEESYRANPKSDPAIGDFLMAKVADDVRTENYEEGKRVGEILLEKGYDDKGLQAFLGMAEYATGDFADAKIHLKEAEAAGKLQAVKPATEAIQFVDQKAAQWEEEAAIRAAEAKADDLPRVKLSTSKGDIVVELFENEAPNTVANFVSLVEKGFYDGRKFHRVIPGFMAQGGCPRGDGTGGPGYTIDCETQAENARKHFRGTLSMAHAGPNTGGSQFFITFVPTPHLDGGHTVFGRVVEGMDVLAKIQRTEGTAKLGSPDKIEKAEVLRKRDHQYVPKKNSG